MYLFFDTETTGIPRRRAAPVTDLDNWPRVVQLAFVHMDAQANAITRGAFIIKPVGFVIPPDAARVHGITTERALAEGVPVQAALAEFQAAAADASVLVAHNMDFDGNILAAELLRAGLPNLLAGKRKRICTMELATNFCAIPGRYGFKWPTLSELHHKLFNADFAGAHSALADAEACAKCFFELRRMGVIRET